MKIIIMGGDRRFVCLRELLEKDGHRVFPLATEKEPQGPPDWRGTEAVVLPLPAEREGRLNAPLSPGEYRLRELLEPLSPGTKVFAGMAGEGLRDLCRERGLILHDYFQREDFQIKNALLTAEGAVGLLLGLEGRALMGRRVLIAGFGRIGRLLAPRLRALGCSVGVMARSAADRAWAEAMGCSSMKKPGGAFDFVLNTVPAVIFGEKELEYFGKAKLVELASAPGGFDRAAAEALGTEIVKAPGLPAVWAMDSAAEAIRDTVYNILEE